jgi:hypothetical protein
MEEVYRRYLRTCNEHRFDDLGEFVHADVALYRFADRKIAEVWDIADDLSVLRQLTAVELARASRRLFERLHETRNRRADVGGDGPEEGEELLRDPVIEYESAIGLSWD